jgi:hypothetical protein
VGRRRETAREESRAELGGGGGAEAPLPSIARAALQDARTALIVAQDRFIDFGLLPGSDDYDTLAAALTRAEAVLRNRGGA